MADNPLLEAALENAEAIADTLIDNELLKSIPVVGTIVKLLHGTLDIRDRLFTAKIERFIRDLDSVSEKTKERIRKCITDNPKEAIKIGETILLVIERASDIEKTHIIAILFIAYVDKQINVTEFRRLCAAVDIAFLDDIIELLKKNNILEKSKESYMQFLAASGFTMPVTGHIWSELGDMYYEVTLLGKSLKNACLYGQHLLDTE